MRCFIRWAVTTTVCVALFGCLVGCAGFRLHIKTNQTTLESIPGGKNKIVIDHPEGSAVLVEVDLIGSFADTAGALLAVFGNPLEWFLGNSNTADGTP